MPELIRWAWFLKERCAMYFLQTSDVIFFSLDLLLNLRIEKVHSCKRSQSKSKAYFIVLQMKTLSWQPKELRSNEASTKKQALHLRIIMTQWYQKDNFSLFKSHLAYQVLYEYMGLATVCEDWHNENNLWFLETILVFACLGNLISTALVNL